MKKRAINFISLLLATTLVVESPVIAFAEENDSSEEYLISVCDMIIEVR